MEEGLLTACPVCSNVRLIEPVGLSCGHFTCWPCINEHRASGTDSSHLCPHSLYEYEYHPAFLDTSACTFTIYQSQ